MRRTIIVSVLLLSLAGTGIAIAADPSLADQDVQYRQGVLKSFGKTFKELNILAKSPAIDGDTAAQIKQDAIALHDNADEPWDHFGLETRATSLKTTAGDKIWSDPAGFKKAQDNFRSSVEKLLAVANAPTIDSAALNEAIAATGGACKSCHTVYRSE